MLLVAMIVVLATMVDASFGTMSHLRLPPSSPLSYRTSERKFGFCSSTTFVHPTRQRQPVMATFSDDSGTTTTLATANTTTSITSTATATANRPPLSVPHPRPPSMWWLDVMSPLLYKIEQFVVNRMILPTVPATTTVDTMVNSHHHDDHHHDDTNKVFDHSLWNAVLQRHVQPYPPETIGTIPKVTVVDYDGVARDPDFAQYLQHLRDHTPILLLRAQEEERPLLRLDLAPAEELAFWINAYNALCISLIVQARQQRQPLLTSINDLSQNQAQPVWDQVAGSIGGVELTLNDIEHGHLRRLFPNEPRIHACIVCASASCPNLRREAFVGTKVYEQMDDQMTDWMSNPYKGLYWDPRSHRVYLSRILLWFASDFERNLVPASSSSSLLSWLSRYVTDPSVAQALQTANHQNSRPLSIRYFDYDWTLNQKTDAGHNASLENGRE